MSRELPCKVTLCQSMMDERKMSEVIYSATEMGVTDIIPIVSERIFCKSDEILYDGAAHNRRVSSSKAFMRNSLREVHPEVHHPLPFSKAMKLVSGYDVAILAYENENDPMCTKKAIEACKDAKNVIIFIGPERGFEPEEVELAKSNGVKIVTLGKRIIQAVNAGAILMGMLVYELELR